MATGYNHEELYNKALKLENILEDTDDGSLERHKIVNFRDTRTVELSSTVFEKIPEGEFIRGQEAQRSTWINNYVLVAYDKNSNFMSIVKTYTFMTKKLRETLEKTNNINELNNSDTRYEGPCAVIPTRDLKKYFKIQ